MATKKPEFDEWFFGQFGRDEVDRASLQDLEERVRSCEYELGGARMILMRYHDRVKMRDAALKAWTAARTKK